MTTECPRGSAGKRKGTPGLVRDNETAAGSGEVVRGGEGTSKSGLIVGCNGDGRGGIRSGKSDEGGESI